MYDEVYDAMIEAGLANKLEIPAWVDVSRMHVKRSRHSEKGKKKSNAHTYQAQHGTLS